MAERIPAHVHDTLKDMAERTMYRRLNSEYGLTLSFLERRNIGLEGVPAVGKTTLMHSIAVALRALGENAVTHEENRDQEMLDEFASNPRALAFWFQMYKLGKRQRLCQELENESKLDAVHILDRTLPGDMAFALYNYIIGNFTLTQFRIYMKELTEISYRPPFLLIYLTASPETLVHRVAIRAFEFEIATYDVEYFKLMDVCYRIALEMSGSSYCVINWDASITGIEIHGRATEKPLVPTKNVMELLETAIKATYHDNINRIHDTNGTTPINANAMLFPGTGEYMHMADPDALVEKAHGLLRKSGVFSSEMASTDEPCSTTTSGQQLGL